LRLRNDADRRMAEVISSLRFAVAPLGVGGVSRGNLDTWIRELREREASVRRLRRRLEALRDGDGRTCPACGRPVLGRADAIYCSSLCRIRAHRGSPLATATAVTTTDHAPAGTKPVRG
jgi:hypothetical protein